MMYISVDQMVMGGANLAIEIQRVAMDKLRIELEMRGLLIPKVMHFQFDNCGENKVNKYIYSEYLILISLIFMCPICMNAIRTRKCSVMLHLWLSLVISTSSMSIS